MRTRPAILRVSLSLSLASLTAVACTAPGEEVASSEEALRAKHVLVVGSSSYDNDDDDIEPTPAERATGDGAKLRLTRQLERTPKCVLPTGTYSLESAPLRSDDGIFWHVIFDTKPVGLGAEECAPSGWVEASAVRFQTTSVADPTPAPTPSSPTPSTPATTGGGSCAANAGFRPNFLKPLRGPVTSRFGQCRDGCSRQHAGIDVAASTGTKIVAVEDGVVIDARSGVGACGTVLEVRHPNGASTRFCHNHRLLVRKGDCVRRGQPIAEVGNTGIGTGPHMPLEYYPRPTGGAANPAPLFGY